MSESTRILDQLQRAYDGDAWHGPALRTVLANVTAEQAVSRPGAGLHNIWELVAHVIAWQRIVARRLGGDPVKVVPENVNFPTITQSDAAAWQQTLEDLAAAHQELAQAISRMNDGQLDATVPGQNYSVYVMVHGVIQHNLYHAGQVALLKKM